VIWSNLLTCRQKAIARVPNWELLGNAPDF
jgi:hypothetical protein